MMIVKSYHWGRWNSNRPREEKVRRLPMEKTVEYSSEFIELKITEVRPSFWKRVQRFFRWGRA